MYHYKVKEIKKIYDGDTIIVVLDLGLGILKTEKLRLARINAPELRGEEHDQGIKSRDYLREILYSAVNENKEITIRTLKDRKGKFGRYLAEIFVDKININNKMITEGYAKKYKG